MTCPPSGIIGDCVKKLWVRHWIKRGGGDDKKGYKIIGYKSHILKFNMWLENADQWRTNDMETIIRVSQIFINNKIKILLPNSAHRTKPGGAYRRMNQK